MSPELFEGLLMLQHRGQDSAGMVTTSGRKLLRAQGQRSGQRCVLRQDDDQAGGCAASRCSSCVPCTCWSPTSVRVGRTRTGVLSTAYSLLRQCPGWMVHCHACQQPRAHFNLKGLLTYVLQTCALKACHYHTSLAATYLEPVLSGSSSPWRRGAGDAATASDCSAKPRLC